jgi:hypothetical protein
MDFIEYGFKTSDDNLNSRNLEKAFWKCLLSQIFCDSVVPKLPFNMITSWGIKTGT